MAPNDPRRHELLRKLQELLGNDLAAALMESLPPDRWDHLATKADLEAFATKADLERFATNDERCAAADPRCVENPEIPAYLYYPSYTRNDLSVSYDTELNNGTGLSVFGGVRNMFNKDIFVPRTGDAYEGGIGNYDSKFGGGIGRFYFLGLEMQFGQ